MNTKELLNDVLEGSFDTPDASGSIDGMEEGYVPTWDRTSVDDWLEECSYRDSWDYE